MDWNMAIEKNRVALKRILAALVAMAGLGGIHPSLACRPFPPQGGRSAVVTLPRHLHRAVLRLLRPAEAAARRLIIVVARDLPHPEVRGQRPSLEGRPRAANPAPQPDKAGNPPTLPLFDPLPRFRGPARPAAAGVPRISLPGFSAPFPVAPRRPPLADDPIDGAHLVQRLQALAAALDDLPSHARRFARWRAQRDAALYPSPCGGPKNGRDPWLVPRRATEAERRIGRRGGGAAVQDPHPAASRRPSPQGGGWRRRVWPLRPGRPPGWRERPVHEVHRVLTIVHDLAFWAMERADTS